MYYWSDLKQFERLRNDALAGKRVVQAAMLRTRNLPLPVMRIYVGPPGTGKTVAAVQAAVAIADPGWSPSAGTEEERLAETFEHFWGLGTQVEFITFSPGDQYETVVEAIRPRLTSPTGGGDAKVDYQYWQGPILRIIRQALSSRDPHVLVIDEINRADISQVLGPLIAAIEADKRLGSLFPVPFQVRYAETSLNEFVPANLHILGTMNSADRNLALVDVALRRRFEFVRMSAEPTMLTATKDASYAIDLPSLLRSVNRRVSALLGADFEIGHSYFLGLSSNGNVIRAFATQVIPLLEEYFYGDDEGLLLVLGELPSASPAERIFDVDIGGESTLEPVFGSVAAAQAAVQHITGPAGKPAYQLRLRREFWDWRLDPPGPGDSQAAARALIKIYAAA